MQAPQRRLQHLRENNRSEIIPNSTSSVSQTQVKGMCHSSKLTDNLPSAHQAFPQIIHALESSIESLSNLYWRSLQPTLLQILQRHLPNSLTKRLSLRSPIETGNGCLERVCTSRLIGVRHHTLSVCHRALNIASRTLSLNNCHIPTNRRYMGQHMFKIEEGSAGDMLARTSAPK